MDKILFVDIDGVLNSSASFYFNKRNSGDKEIDIHKRFDPMCSECFRFILKNVPDLQIVISSTWRGDCSQEKKNYIIDRFKEQDINVPLHEDWHTIRHWTIEKNFCKGRKPKGYSKDWRGNEVSEWLFRHPEITTWACVDDDSDFLDFHNLILTDNTVGLTMREARALIYCFTKDEKLLDYTVPNLEKYSLRRNKLNLKTIKRNLNDK